MRASYPHREGVHLSTGTVGRLTIYFDPVEAALKVGDIARDVVTEKYILGMRILMLGYEHALRATMNSNAAGANGMAEFQDNFRRMAARGAASTVLALAENLPKIIDKSTIVAGQDVERAFPPGRSLDPQALLPLADEFSGRHALAVRRGSLDRHEQVGTRRSEPMNPKRSKHPAPHHPSHARDGAMPAMSAACSVAALMFEPMQWLPIG